MRFYPLLMAMTLSALSPTIGRAQNQEVAVPLKAALPLLRDRFELKKEQWPLSDRAWFERDAVTGAPNLIETLANVADIANSIDGDPNSPTYGWQKSNLYRDGQKGPTNARLMEPVYTLAWAYTLNKPWNPYYRDPILRARMEAGLTYWLSLQGKDGGFSENGGKGSQELPSTSFSLEFLVEIHEMLDLDGTADKGLRDHLFDSIQRAVLWASSDEPSRVHGTHYSNQYCGVMYALYRLWQQTKDPKWKALFDSDLDYWLEHAQPSLFWLEADGVETFGYSHVTEWEMDRLLLLSNDARILEAFRKYFEWCGLNTVPENDGQTFIMDTAGHGRTTNKGLAGQVGYYNHIARVLPEARAFATKYMMTLNQREERVKEWLQSPFQPTSRVAGRERTSAYHPFHNYPMFFEPLGLWTQSVLEQRGALAELPPLANTRFTRYFHVPAGNDYYLFARRRDVYTTLHWGQTGGNRQVKGVGLVWIPGFGTLVRSSNEPVEDTYATLMGKVSSFRKPILDFAVPDSFKNAPANGSVEAGDLEFSTHFGNIGIAKTFRITESALEVTTRTQEAATEQIPLYLDADDTLTLDGQTLAYPTQPGDAAVPLAGRQLRVKRTCGGITAYATVEFGTPMTGTLRRSYDLAQGHVYVLSVAVPANTDFLVRFKKG